MVLLQRNMTIYEAELGNRQVKIVRRTKKGWRVGEPQLTIKQQTRPHTRQTQQTEPSSSRRSEGCLERDKSGERTVILPLLNRLNYERLTILLAMPAGGLRPEHNLLLALRPMAHCRH